MLHWLAGQKLPEGQSDPDTTGYVEPPETPAPVFAVRAFKHAIFGTPQTVQPKPRRHSNTENARSRPQGSRAERPHMTRPKSAGDAHALGVDGDALVPEPASSPTKGILMTPGTAAAKRKTVTFGDHVVDNEEKRPMKSGLPDDCPGKFPSPWTAAGPAEEDGKTLAQKDDKARGRTKLTEALEQARDESTKRNNRMHKRTRSKDDDDITKDFEEPKSESGRYWKTQYDSYRENSQREIKKLITKQKAAKSFAREKDIQCTELADDLRQERKKVEKLEKRTAELEAQLKIIQERLAKGGETERKVEQDVPRPELANRRCYKSEAINEPQDTPHLQLSQPVVLAREPTAEARPAKQPFTAQTQPAPKEEAKADTTTDPAKPRARTRPVHIRTKTNDDIWNQSVGSSSPVISRSVERPPPSPKAGRSVTSGTGATPLMSLSVNALPSAQLTRRDSAQPSPPADRFAKEPLVRQEVVRSPRPDEKRNDSPILSPGLPQPSPEPVTETRTAPKLTAARKEAAPEATDLSMPLPASSPFQPSPMLSLPGADAKKTSYFDRSAAHSNGPSGSPLAKENVSPPAKARPAQAEAVRPTAAWNAINAPNVGKRVASLTDKSGKEVSVDRIEAARARMAARGRVLS